MKTRLLTFSRQESIYSLIKDLVVWCSTAIIRLLPLQGNNQKPIFVLTRVSVKKILQEKWRKWRQVITLAFIRLLRKYGIMSCMRWSYNIVKRPVKMCGMIDEWVQSENGFYLPSVSA